MRKTILFTAFLFFLGLQVINAQTKVVKGKVTSADDNSGIPGATVMVKGTTIGTITGASGDYEISFDEKYTTLIFSFMGMETKEVDVTGKNTVNVALKTSVTELEGAVVTAIGISREKKSLGYATQEVGGEEVNAVKSDNFVNSLSGKVSGVQVKANSNMGGSTNIIIRGSTSLTGNNQAMFVIDGVPVSNDNTNASSQKQGGSGYDYGNAASDINPDDIESINVLKGAAATALYGSRAANGVIIITTKKGSKQMRDGKNAIGIMLGLSATVGVIDRSTFPEYQTKYGAGYGPYYSGGDHPGLEEDVNGVLYVPFTEDASYGEKFDENLMVRQWTSFIPEHENYGKATPWKNAAHGPIDFFDNSFTTKNTVAFYGANDASSFRVSYTNLYQTGIMPNSKLKRNNISFNASHNLTKNLTVSGSANYTNTDVSGRNSTGYSNNILSSYRQWWQTNVDVKDLEDMYNKTGRNVTWNMADARGGDYNPIYWDNFYWDRYENVQSDVRDRIVGNAMVNWKVFDWMSLMGRASVDYYSTIQEERLAVGSIARRFGISRNDVGSGYSRYNRTYRETNYDMIANFNHRVNDDISLMGLVGANIRRTNINTIFASTNGGLVVPKLYSLSNSVNPVLSPTESESIVGVNGMFAQASIGFKDTYYLEGTIRRDKSSTLPEGSNAYIYPSISGNIIFSELVKADWLNFGKFRANYAEVGNSAPFASVLDVYSKPAPFGSIPLFSVPSTKNNANLKPERTKSFELGVEMKMLNNRFGVDLSVYKTNTIDQILPVSVSTATGYSYKYVNSGEIENKGIEIALTATAMKSEKFQWDVILNWSKNVNKVLSLYDGVDNLTLGSFQGGITLNATVGQPYGTIQGTDYTYDENGNKKIYDATGSRPGQYIKTATSDNVIGNINPDFNMGLTNRFTYGQWGLSFLIDWQQGGDIFSLDHWYGEATGLYALTAENNDLGNPLRDPIVGTPGNYAGNSGGILQEGVFPDGTPNNIRIKGDRYTAFGYARNPNKRYIYDASYVKLREVVLSYRLKMKKDNKSFIQGATFSFVGSNLWIIHKNLPDADPEAGLSSGNLQGFQSGVMPTTRNFGININLTF
ncbi:MAG: SusC/RagA family TonB-linked outer membrane protein [Bacteroidetes bacterium]|nr:MAG: SusC/RagA family TonB-linked outer membrane protein [Bacteroidota bacterium]